MTEKGASSARRFHGAAHSVRAAAQRPERGNGLLLGLLALGCMAAGVTATTQAPPARMLVKAPAAAVAQAVAATPAPAATLATAVAQAVPGPSAATVADAAVAIFPILADAEASDEYYNQLRAQVRWKEVRVGTRKVATPDARSRLLLAKSAAEVAELDEVGLDYRDVYGVINAETTWLPRTGMGKNGVASFGLAQFEPATARAVGLRNPNDPVEAVHAAAVLLKEAANWSSRRIAGLDLTPEVRAAKLREGVSIYYNLSSRARRAWSGANTHKLPVETLRHIRNVRVGAEQAGAIFERLGNGAPAVPGLSQASYVPAPPVTVPVPPATRAEPLADAKQSTVKLAAASRKQAAPSAAARPVIVADRTGRKTWVLPQGTIAWSRSNG